PSTLIGSLLGALAVLKKGPELDQDPDYKERLLKGLISSSSSTNALEGKQLSRARGSVIVFLVAAILVVVLGLFPSIRPSYTVLNGDSEGIEQLEMAPAIMIFMLAAAGINMLFFHASPADTIKSGIMNAGIVALISIAGL